MLGSVIADFLAWAEFRKRSADWQDQTKLKDQMASLRQKNKELEEAQN